MSQMKLVLVAIFTMISAGNSLGQQVTIKPVSSTPLKMQSLGNRPAVTTENFHSIQTLRSQSVSVSANQQPDLESEVTALQQQEAAPQDSQKIYQRVQSPVDLVLPGSIRNSRVNILPSDKRTPDDRSPELMVASPASWHSFSSTGLLVHWDAPQIRYGKLYFEDPVLERYGQSSNPTREVVQSAIHFSVSTMFWPVRQVLDFPGKCETPYGYCRPGSPMPCMSQNLLGR